MYWIYRIIRLLTVFCSLLLPSSLLSQELKLKTYLDTTSILIGDQLKFNIELEQPKNARVGFPVFSDTLTSKIEILGSEPADTSKQGDRFIIRKSFLITSFDSGYHAIPSFPFVFSNQNISDTISSQAIYLKVNTLPVDTASDITDIKPVMRTPFSLREIKREILAVLAILAIVAVIVWLIVRRKKYKTVFAPEKPAEPPHITALRELDRLREEKLWQNNLIKLYYTRITDILRVYIYGRFGVNAMEMTSDEILAALNNELNTDMELKTSFTRLLQQSDMVKFAKEEPLPQENEVAILSAYTFVNRTKIEVISQIAENSKISDEQEKE